MHFLGTRIGDRFNQVHISEGRSLELSDFVTRPPLFELLNSDAAVNLKLARTQRFRLQTPVRVGES